MSMERDEMHACTIEAMREAISEQFRINPHPLYRMQLDALDAVLATLRHAPEAAPQPAPPAPVDLFPISVPSSYVRDHGQDGDRWVRLGAAEEAIRALAAPKPQDGAIEIERECREAWKQAAYWRRIATGTGNESEAAQQLEAVANDLTDLLSEEQERALLGAASLIRRLAKPQAAARDGDARFARGIAHSWEGGGRTTITFDGYFSVDLLRSYYLVPDAALAPQAQDGQEDGDANL